MRRTTGSITALLSAIVAGCAGEPPNTPVVVADSAGIRIVTHQDSPRQRIGAVGAMPTLVVGRDGDLPLYEVTGGFLGPDGRIVVANAGSSEILVVDRTGALIRTIGRPGSGPGEFGSIEWLQARADGGFHVGDGRNRRVSAFDSDGELLWTRAYNPQPDPPDAPNALTARGFALHATDDGSLIAFPRAIALPDGEPGLLPLTGELRLYEPDLTSFDEFGSFQVIEWYEDPTAGAIPLGNMLGGARVEYSGHSGRFAYTEGSRFEVEVFDAGIPSMRIRESRPRVLFEPDSVPESVVHVADSLPAYRGVMVDGLRRVWVGAPTSRDGSRTEWRVFGAEGAWIGTLQLPGNADPLDAADHHVLLLTRDTLDVESVELRTLRWPG